jgi:Spy/CpxP family protein refolding chaperone
MKRVKETRIHFLAALAVAGCLLAGCGENSVNDTSGLNRSTLRVSDPLDGVLNSTDGTTPVNPDRRIERLAEVLGLDDTQKAALIEAYATLRSGLESLRAQVEDGTLTLEQARAQADLLREQFEAALQVILTAEQWEKLQEMRQDRDGDHRGERDPVERWLAWLNEIGATEAQVSSILSAVETLRDGLEAIRAQVQSGAITFDEARAQVGALRQAFNQTLQQILTPEQYQALLELRPDCSEGDGHHPRR